MRIEIRAFRAMETALDATNRRWIEEKLRESEARTRAILDSALDCIVCFDHHGKIYEFNLAAEKTFKHIRAAMLGKEFAGTLLSPSVRDAYRWSFAQHLATGSGPFVGTRNETIGLRADGTEFPLEMSTTRMQRDSTPSFTAYLRDITDRKRAEEILRSSEESYRLLFERNLAGVYRSTIDGRMLDCNESFARMLGYDSKDEVLGLPAWHFYENEEDRRTALARLWEQGSLTNFELKLRRKDGSCLWVLQNISLLEGSDGSPTVLQGTAVDITQRRQAEEALRESEERYRNLFESVPIGIYRTTPDGHILMANPTLVRMLRYSSFEELTARNRETNRFEPQNVRSKFKEALERAGEVTGIEATWIRRDGSIMYALENARAVRGADGSVLYYEGTIEDITTGKQLEEQLRQSQKMEAIGRLAGGLAHDFNNLLMVITGHSELLLGREAAGEDPVRPIEQIHKAAERAAELTRQLLAFSRMQVLQPTVLDLNQVISNMDDMLRRLVGEGIEFVAMPWAALARVKADEGQIEQVILNLVLNARDAMPNGGKLTIETANVELDEEYARGHRPTVPGQYVMLAVSDTGIGMDSETKAHIFEPFFTTKEKGKGTGLGLATVYGVVKQSGGFIWVESEVGQGTTFKIYLPQVLVRGEQPSAAQQSSSTVLRGTETILLVEDEAEVREVTREFLKANGYKVLEACNGPEALEVAGKHDAPIDLLLSDVVMPRMSGPELAERLASQRPGIRMLFMSGYAQYERPEGQANAPATLQKPFAFDLLASKVREALGGPSSR